MLISFLLWTELCPLQIHRLKLQPPMWLFGDAAFQGLNKVIGLWDSNLTGLVSLEEAETPRLSLMHVFSLSSPLSCLCTDNRPRDGTMGRPHLQTSPQTNATGILTVDRQPLELWAKKFLLFKLPILVFKDSSLNRSVHSQFDAQFHSEQISWKWSPALSVVLGFIFFFNHKIIECWSWKKLKNHLAQVLPFLNFVLWF